MQLENEACVTSRRHRGACFHEIVSCHDSCVALPHRQFYGACVPGLPLRTGWNGALPCSCNASMLLSNCALSAPELPPPTAFLALNTSTLTKTRDHLMWPAPAPVRRACSSEKTQRRECAAAGNGEGERAQPSDA